MCRAIKPNEVNELTSSSEPGELERCCFILNQIIIAKSDQFKGTGKIIVLLEDISEFSKEVIKETLDKFVKARWSVDVKQDTHIVFKSRVNF